VSATSLNGTTTRTILQSGDSASGSCTNDFKASNASLWVQRLGDSTMNISSPIHLFNSTNFLGYETQVNPSSNVSSVNYNVRSYWFTGTGNAWMCYSSANYSGTATCVGPTDTVKRLGWGHSYSFDVNWNCKSVRRVDSCPNNGAASSLSMFGFISSALALLILSQTSVESYVV